MRRRRKGATGRIPFPRSDTTAGDPSAPTISEGETLQRCSTNTSSSIADAAPQEGSFTRCFSFLKRVGVDLIMPPYTIDEWFNNIVSAQTSLVGLRLTRGFAVTLVADTRLPRILL